MNRDRLLLLVLMSLTLPTTGCVRQVLLPSRPEQMAPPPDAWRTVEIKRVHGTQSTSTALRGNLVVSLDRAPTDFVRDILRSRIGDGGQRPVQLFVDNISYAIAPGGDFGVAADITLLKGEQKLQFTLEHSVNVPAQIHRFADLRKAVYTRAVVDFTDRLLFHKDVLAFLGASTVKASDSALTQGIDVGPMGDVDPSSGTEKIEAGGRVLWGDAELEQNGQLSILLGDAKGAIGYFLGRDSHRYYGWRYGFGAGGISAGNTGLFTLDTRIAFEVGYRQTRYSESGYVESPGISFMVVPQISSMLIGGESFFMNMLQFGGSFELDVPIGRYFGITGAFFMGAAAFNGTVGSTDFSGISDFLYFPSGDLYVQTSVGRISLGLLFQQIASGGNIGDIFENPVITITYRSLRGRGIAYERSRVSVSDFDVSDEEKEFASPRSVFTMPQATHVKPDTRADAAGSAATAAGAATPPVVGPPPTPAETAQWYYVLGTQKVGPLSAVVLKQLLDAGQLKLDTLVWRQGMSGWKKLAEVPELAPAPPATPPPPPPPTSAPATPPGSAAVSPPAGAAGDAGTGAGAAPTVGAATPTPAPQPGPKVWYYGIAQQRNGPVDAQEIRKLFAAGSLNGETLLWKSGMAGWTKLRSVPEFADLEK